MATRPHRDGFADYLPDRGVRDFPPDTAMDERGREQWYERAT